MGKEMSLEVIGFILTTQFFECRKAVQRIYMFISVIPSFGINLIQGERTKREFFLVDMKGSKIFPCN